LGTTADHQTTSYERNQYKSLAQHNHSRES
jgi:hypothetical protein